MSGLPAPGQLGGRRRFCILAALLGLAACAGPAVPPPAPAPTPAPAAPKDPAAVRPPTASGDMVFDAWARGFYARALKAGIAPAVLDRELAGLSPNPRVGNLDRRQPEFSKPISDYIRGAVDPGRIAAGQRRRAEMTELSAIEQRYGVPRDILLAIWAMESGFGASQGDFDVIRAMATLAAEGRRREFAEDQLIAALRLIQTGEVSRGQLRGSWAGGMGHTQFIPTSFASMAVDGDGDGRRDVWGSSADALASAANLLLKGGWTPGQSWAREVTAPADFDFGLTEGPRETPAWWAGRGVRRADGLPWAAADLDARAQIIAPAGADGPLFLLFPNHFAIRKYNNSLAYALAAGLLADGFSGQGQPLKPWPAETPLALSDRMTAQRALAALGFDPGAPDGVVGAGTRSALRAWQTSRGLPADGYLSAAMIQRLKAETDGSATPLTAH